MNNLFSMPSHAAAHSRRPVIVIVDDDKKIADSLTLILSSKGYDVEAAYDGSSALEICGRLKPDMVLSDVVMPGMNGIELAIAVQKEFPRCQLLLFSGQAAAVVIVEDAGRRGYDFEILGKPVYPDLLLARIKELIGPGGAPAVVTAR